MNNKWWAASPNIEVMVIDGYIVAKEVSENVTEAINAKSKGCNSCGK